MTTYAYERVETRGQKSGPCTVCGRRATRSEMFGQTLNPFNKNADGTVKTRAEIWDEINRQRAEWEQSPVAHAGCER